MISDAEDKVNQLPNDGSFPPTDDCGDPIFILQCKTCESKTFNVAVGPYYAAIRCLVCGWAECINSG